MERWVSETTPEDRIASVLRTTDVEQRIDAEWLETQCHVDIDDAEFALELLTKLDFMTEQNGEFAFDHRFFLFLTVLEMVDDRSYQDVYEIKEELERVDGENIAQNSFLHYYRAAATMAAENYEMLTIPHQMQDMDDGTEEMMIAMLESISGDSEAVGQS